MVAIVSQKREVILKAVEDMYTEVANRPGAAFHFPIGHEACRFVGYPADALDSLPASAVESFAGVGYPFAADVIRAGDTVLDIGSGSGTDALIAARRAGARGKVYALDLTAAMRAKLTRNAAGAGNIEVLAGNAEAIPLPDRSVDAVTSNGVLNLVPDKARAIAEIFRVLKPGGRLQISDIALAKPVTGKARRDPKLWAECIVGAVEEEQYFELFRRAGFRHLERVGGLDYFAASRSEDTRLMAGYFGAHSVTFRARKPEAWELARAPREDAAVWHLLRGVVRQAGGVAAAFVAAAACFGSPLLLAGLAAAGVGAIATHAYLYPAFVGFAALSLRGLYCSTRERGDRRPFWWGLAGALIAAAALWLMITALYPLPAWTVYGGVALLLAGVGWDLAERYLEVCVVKVRREMTRAPTVKPFGRRMTHGAALSVAAAAAFYGMYKSVDALAPQAETGQIACYGINACKGQTQCATAHNACPGLNSCQGKGFLYAPATECTAKGGVPLKDSPADPAKA